MIEFRPGKTLEVNRNLFGAGSVVAIGATLYAPLLGIITVPAAAALIAGLAMERVRLEHGNLPNQMYAVLAEEE